jgi:hypothetical protein
MIDGKRISEFDGGLLKWTAIVLVVFVPLGAWKLFELIIGIF